ncbi:MAG: hypothetical protein RL323_677 [Pseudomonadota bacterium]|jgi:hypothetical protein
MKTGLSFLIAAKRCEITELQQLALTAELVSACAQTIHSLQRERGMSNLFLASGGAQFAPERGLQVLASDTDLLQLRQGFDALQTDPHRHGQGTRLFNRVAYVLHALDALDDLRNRVQTLQWGVRLTTNAYSQLIRGLLAVVFEAADTSSDPAVARLLVAMFNFMQGKELVGQERALGSAMFASGTATVADQQQLLHLVESQEKCLAVFDTFAPPALAGAWTQAPQSPAQMQRSKLRRVLTETQGNGALNTHTSGGWFAACSDCLDEMRALEGQLGEVLAGICTERMASAQKEHDQLLELQATFAVTPPNAANAELFFSQATGSLADAPNQPLDSLLDRTLMEAMASQTQRMQTMADELNQARQSLQERKLLERAKGVLMANQHLSEAQAHKVMRQMAMNQNRRMTEVAQSILALAHALPLALEPTNSART